MTEHALDWPTDTADAFYRAPQLDDFRSDREGLETLTLRALCWWRGHTSASDALGMLEPSDFARGANGMVFDAISRLDEDRRTTDPAEIADWLGDRLSDVGGLKRLMELFAGDYPGADPTIYASLLAEWAARERQMGLVKQLPERVKAGDLDPDKVASDLSRHVADRQHGIDRVGDVWERVVDRIADPAYDAGVSPGWRALERYYRIARQAWTVVTGIPGSGKSTLVDNIAVNLANDLDWRFAVFSPENAPTDRHVMRLIGLWLRKPPGACQTDELAKARDWVAEHFEWINSTEGVDLVEILRRADVIHRRRKIDGLLIDPWNEVDREAGSRETETLRISEGITRIRRWARRRDAHVWVVAHPTKLVKDHSGQYQRPTLYDVSHSATWRDKADMGLVVHRDQVRGGPTEVHVSKVRFASQGRLGRTDLVFDTESERFKGAVAI